jgi:hypothetical protein
MPSKATSARVGVKSAAMMSRHPHLRRVAVPVAKAGWVLGKFVIKRKARGRLDRLSEIGQTAASAVIVYGPMAAEVLRLYEPPKPRQRLPVFVAGISIGAGAMYSLGRNKGG